MTGPWGHNTTGDDNRMTQIFTFENGNWTQKGQSIIGYHMNSTKYDAYWGWSVAIDGPGNRVLTAGLFDGEEWEGAVQVYDYDNDSGIWTQIGSTIVGENYYEELGQSVAMCKDEGTLTVCAGCYHSCKYKCQSIPLG